MNDRKKGEFLYDFTTARSTMTFSAHRLSCNRIIVYWYEKDMTLSSSVYSDYTVERNLKLGHWKKVNIHCSPEFVQKVVKTIELERKTYLVDVRSEDEAFIVDVLWSINLPNNPSYDDLIAEWVLDNFGETPYEYYSLADLKRKEISYY